MVQLDSDFNFVPLRQIIKMMLYRRDQLGFSVSTASLLSIILSRHSINPGNLASVGRVVIDDKPEAFFNSSERLKVKALFELS